MSRLLGAFGIFLVISACLTTAAPIPYWFHHPEASSMEILMEFWDIYLGAVILLLLGWFCISVEKRCVLRRVDSVNKIRGGAVYRLPPGCEYHPGPVDHRVDYDFIAGCFK